MRTQYSEFLDAVLEWSGYSSGLPRVIAAARAIPPNLVWATLSLSEYRCRQDWAYSALGRIVEDEYAEGFVPSHPEWEYSLEADMSFVWNRVTGERVHIDIVNGASSVCIGHVFAPWTAASDTLANRRLRLYHPHVEGVECLLILLSTWGFLDPMIDNEFGTLAELDEYQIELQYLARDSDCLNQIAQAEERSNLKWLAMLENMALEDGIDGPMLYALADARSDKIDRYVEDAIVMDSSACYAALDVIHDDPSWCELVWEHLDSFQRKGSKYLAQHGFRTSDVLKRLMECGAGFYSDLIELAIEYAPDMVREIVEVAISSDVLEDGIAAAATLAAIDDDFSRKTLLSNLANSNVYQARVSLMALEVSNDVATGLATERWRRDQQELGQMEPTIGVFLGTSLENLFGNRLLELFPLVRNAKSNGLL